MFGAVLFDLAQRHGLDERKIVALGTAPMDHPGDLVLVQALERHHVDLDLEACACGGFNSAENLPEVAPPGDVPEPVGITAVEADIDAPDAAVEQHPSVPRELRAVGGHGQLVETVADPLPELGDQKLEALADQRLAAGQSDPPHAAGDENVGERDHLLEGQHILARQERHRFRHAVAAAKVAPVGHRQAHIGDAPAEAVDHGIGRDHFARHADILPDEQDAPAVPPMM